MKNLRLLLVSLLILLLPHVGSGQNYYSNPLVLFGNQITDTTVDGKQVFGVVGDSNADGRGATITTVGANILYLWGGSSFTNVTTTSVSNDGVSGSAWQQFAIDYNTNTGFKICLVNGASGGSNFYPDGDNNNWYSSGTLYATFKTNLNSALSNLGLAHPKAIFLNLGVNDARAVTSGSNIQLGIDYLIGQLTTDYPGVPILTVQVGRTESVTFNAGLYDIRKRLIDKVEATATMYMVCNAESFTATSQMNGDALHYSTSGLNDLGSMMARWFVNSAYTNKWSRAVISSQFDNLSSTRKDLIDRVISGLYSRGDYFDLEQLYNFKTTTQNNVYVDWAFLGTSQGSGSTFTANSCITTGGSPNTHIYQFVPSISTRAASATDFQIGAKLKTRTTSSGTLAVMMGAFDGTNNIYVRQSTTNTGVTSNDNTVTNGTESSLTAGHYYGTARNGTTKEIWKDKAVDASATVTSTGACSAFPRLGGYNNNGTVGNYLNAQFEWLAGHKRTSFDFSSFYDDMEALIAGW